LPFQTLVNRLETPKIRTTDLGSGCSQEKVTGKTVTSTEESIRYPPAPVVMAGTENPVEPTAHTVVNDFIVTFAD